MSQREPVDVSKSTVATSRERDVVRPFWPAFVWAATLLALSAGFLLGGYIFLLRAIGARGTEWQAAAVQAHGHIQVFGWGGLMVLGISLHFLPRLLSTPLVRPGLPRHILCLMGSGLVLRALAQPALAHGAPQLVRQAAAVVLALSASLELVAGTFAIGLIGSLFWNRRGSSRRVPSAGVAALIGTAFLSFETALVTNWIGSIRAAVMMRPVISLRFDNATIVLGLAGFLTAMSLAMSARLFPLYVQTGVSRERWLRAAAVTLIAGVALGAAGDLSETARLIGIGQILRGVALICGVIALRVFERRRELPRRRVSVATSPLQLHVATAYLWLGATSCFVLMAGLRNLGISGWTVPEDAERHALGAGFVTILILGVGAEMLPGLARSRLRWRWACWLTLACANSAALARVVPLFLRGMPSGWATSTMSSAGALGAIAIVLFLANVPLKIRQSTTENRSAP